jgi:uncharacterized protein YuzE
MHAEDGDFGFLDLREPVRLTASEMGSHKFVDQDENGKVEF